MFTTSRIVISLPRALLVFTIKGHIGVHQTENESFTCVIPRAPIFSLYEVVPLPLPQAPASMQPIPSIPIPLLMAAVVGGGAPDNLQIYYIFIYIFIYHHVQILDKIADCW